MDYINHNKIRQVSFFILLVVLGYLIFQSLSSFLPALLGAITLYVMMRRPMQQMLRRGMSKGLAATILMLLGFLIILVPIYILVTMLTSKISYAIQNSNKVLAAIKNFSQGIENKYNVHLLSPENLAKASTLVATSLPNILGTTFNILTTLAVMYFILYYMLVQSKEMEDSLARNLPLKRENSIWIGKDFQELVFNNAIGMPLISFTQGLVALIGYLILGVPDALFWFVVTSFGAMVPFIGAALGYIPLGILLLAQGPTWKGIAILIYGLLIVGLSDNVFRIMLQRKLGDIHPLITLFGVVLGVNIFGFIGLIFGPILISLFLLLVKIYTNEFSSKTN